jgi:hypothetical protein
VRDLPQATEVRRTYSGTLCGALISNLIKTSPENTSYANNQLSVEILMLQQSNTMITINDLFGKVSKIWIV